MFYNKLTGGKDLTLDNLNIYSSNSNAFVVKDSSNYEVFKIDTNEKKAYLNADLLLANPPVSINTQNLEIEDILIRLGKGNSQLGDIKDTGIYIEYKNPDTNQINYTGLIRKAGNTYGYALFKNYNGNPDLSPWSSSNYDNLHVNDLYSYNQILAANGNMNSPGISFIGSPSTGIYNYNNSLFITALGTKKIGFDIDGINLYDHLSFNDKNIIGANYVFCNGFYGINMNGDQPFIYRVGNITAGTWSADIISPSYGGTGYNLYNTGEILIGNSSGGLTKNTLTGTTNQIYISNFSGEIVLSLPQDISITSNPVFNELSLNSFLNMNNQNINNVNNISANNITGVLQTGNQSNITGLGTITSGIWNGSIISPQYGGIGYSTFSNGELLIGNSATNSLSKSILSGVTNQININNGNGSIQLSTPQNLDTSANFQVGDLKLNTGNLNMNSFNIVNAGTINATNGYNGTILTANQTNITAISSSLNQLLNVTLPTQNIINPFSFNGLILAGTTNTNYTAFNSLFNFRLPSLALNAANTGTLYNINNELTLDFNNINSTIANIVGFKTKILTTNSGSVTNTNPIISNIYNIMIDTPVFSSMPAKTISNYYGLYIKTVSAPPGASAITNSYGLYIENVTSGYIYNKYGIYCQITNNYLAGLVLGSGGINMNNYNISNIGNIIGSNVSVAYINLGSGLTTNNNNCLIDGLGVDGGCKILLRNTSATYAGEIQMRSSAGHGFTIFNQSTSLDLQFGKLVSGAWNLNAITIYYTNGNVKINTNLILSGGGSNLNHYEEAIINMTFSNSNSYNYKAIRVGKKITLHTIQTSWVQFTGSNNIYFESTNTLSANFRPSSDISQSIICKLGSDFYFGKVIIYTTGVIRYYFNFNELAYTSVYSNGTTFYFEGAGISYTIL